MKKVLFLVISLLTIVSFSKANGCITGSTDIIIGTTETYSVDPTLGQCNLCYNWNVSGGISIVGSRHMNSVVIRGNSIGTYTINVTYFDSTGCHNCSLIVNVIEQPCCTVLPIMQSYYICRGWSNGHGGVYIDHSNCNLAIDHMYISLTNAQFTSGALSGQSSGTIYSSFGFPGNIGNNPGCSNITVNIVVYYQNGCESSESELIVPEQDGKELQKAKIFPNPATSEINIDLSSLDGGVTYGVRLFDIETGKEIYNKNINSTNINSLLKINNLDEYRIIQVVILKDSHIVQNSKISIQKKNK